jgi:hypothetical protein
LTDLRAALLIFVACVAGSVFCGWRGARQWDLRKGPRMAPWSLMMLLLATAALFALVAALNLAGYGQPQ